MKHLVLRGLLVALVFGGCYSVFTHSASAATTVSGDIPNGTVWNLAGSPYVVNGASVALGSSLTIEPGVVVKFGHQRGLNVYGSLTAIGTEENKIHFTSVRDDTLAGDTNADGSLTIPAPIDWQQIRVFSGGTATLEHVIVKFGGLPQPPSGSSSCSPELRICRGAITNLGNLHLSESEMTQNYGYDLYQAANGVSEVQNTLFVHAINIGPAVFASGGELLVEGSLIQGGRYGLQVGVGTAGLVLRNNIFKGNGLHAALIDASVDFEHGNNVAESGTGNGFLMAGSIQGERVWHADTMPYIVGNVSVPLGTKLVISPGSVLKFDQAALAVDGTLQAEGAPEEKIYFTSIHDDAVGGDTNGNGSSTSPAAGNWNQIRVFSTASTTISNAVIKYGGNPYRPGLNNCGVGIVTCRGVISLVGTLNMSDVHLEHNFQQTIYQTAGTASLEHVSIKPSNLAPGISMTGGTLGVHNSSIYPSQYYGSAISGIAIDSGTPVVDARNNWWGDASGPKNSALNPSGLGAGVSNGVLFDPWLPSDPFAEIPQPEIDSLILQYEPILYFHEDEDFYPMNVEPFIESSALWDTNGFGEDTKILGVGEVNALTLANPDSEDWYLAFSTPEESKSFDPAAAKSKYDELVAANKAVPTYYAHKMEQGDWIVLQYWYFYAFNNWAEEGGFNNHEGDWESVFVFLNKDTEEPEYVAFSAHHNDGEPSNILQYGSVRRSWNEQEITIEDNKPVSFVAAGSHAHYPDLGSGGIHFVPGLGEPKEDRVSDAGKLYDNEIWLRMIPIAQDQPVWMLYEGLWGADRNLDTFLGESGPLGPYHSEVSGTVRFQEPVKWAGLDKIASETVDLPTKVISFSNQTTVMTFANELPVGTTVTSDQHDELITFGNLDEVKLLPRFWDFSTGLENGSFDVTVQLGYTDEEMSALGLNENKLSVFLFDESAQVWEKIGSVLDTVANTLSFDTTHFSKYAIGQEIAVNTAPELDPIGDQTVPEGGTLSFTVSASDVDEGDTLTYSAVNLPLGASFDPTTQTFIWDTDFDDAGNYPSIEFTVVDDGEPLGLDVELITITVGDVNRAPVFENPGPQEVLEDEVLEFTVSASDPDGDEVMLSAASLPDGVEFSTSTGNFVWEPTRAQEGVYIVSFIAADDGAPQEQAVLEVAITVGDNPTPVELTEDLIELIISHQLPNEHESAYLANLKKVPTFIGEGKITPAIEQLEAFKQKVGSDYKKGKIDAEIKEALWGRVNHILRALSG